MDQEELKKLAQETAQAEYELRKEEYEDNLILRKRNAEQKLAQKRTDKSAFWQTIKWLKKQIKEIIQ